MRAIRFIVAGDVEYSEARSETYVQLREVDLPDMLNWLGLDPLNFGFIEASDLAARCRRRLWPIARNYDPAVTNQVRSTATDSGRPHTAPYQREAGTLRACTEQLLKLAERAGPEGQILFS